MYTFLQISEKAYRILLITLPASLRGFREAQPEVLEAQGRISIQDLRKFRRMALVFRNLSICKNYDISLSTRKLLNFIYFLFFIFYFELTIWRYRARRANLKTPGLPAVDLFRIRNRRWESLMREEKEREVLVRIHQQQVWLKVNLKI